MHSKCPPMPESEMNSCADPIGTDLNIESFIERFRPLLSPGQAQSLISLNDIFSNFNFEKIEENAITSFPRPRYTAEIVFSKPGTECKITLTF
jgi:hypothetical protein